VFVSCQSEHGLLMAVHAILHVAFLYTLWLIMATNIV